MGKGPKIASSLCQLLILALLGYGMNLGCLLQSDGCVQESACCASCNLPAHVDKTDQGAQLKLGPVLLTTAPLSLTSVVLAMTEAEPYLEPDAPARKLLSSPTDPIRGPPPV